MSTVIMAPERPPVPLNGNKLHGQQPRTRLLSRQVLCVVVLALTDLFAIASSLELAILMRKYLVSRVDGYLQPSTFPFAHYVSSGWLWLMPFLILDIVGL